MSRDMDAWNTDWFTFLDHVTSLVKDDYWRYEELKDELKECAKAHRENQPQIEEVAAALKVLKEKVDGVCEGCLGPRWDHDKPFGHRELCRACLAEMVYTTYYEEAFEMIERIDQSPDLSEREKLKHVMEAVNYAREESAALKERTEGNHE